MAMWDKHDDDAKDSVEPVAEDGLPADQQPPEGSDIVGGDDDKVDHDDDDHKDDDHDDTDAPPDMTPPDAPEPAPPGADPTSPLPPAPDAPAAPTPGEAAMEGLSEAFVFTVQLLKSVAARLAAFDNKQRQPAMTMSNFLQSFEGLATGAHNGAGSAGADSPQHVGPSI